MRFQNALVLSYSNPDYDDCTVTNYIPIVSNVEKRGRRGVYGGLYRGLTVVV